jgi:hypothetical protein
VLAAGARDHPELLGLSRGSGPQSKGLLVIAAALRHLGAHDERGHTLSRCQGWPGSRHGGKRIVVLARVQSPGGLEQRGVPIVRHQGHSPARTARTLPEPNLQRSRDVADGSGEEHALRGPALSPPRRLDSRVRADGQPDRDASAATDHTAWSIQNVGAPGELDLAQRQLSICRGRLGQLGAPSEEKPRGRGEEPGGPPVDGGHLSERTSTAQISPQSNV